MEAGDRRRPGSTVFADGVNFAVYSSLAERVELCLFDVEGNQYQCYDLPHCDNGMWNGFVPGLTAGQRYGYRVHGPYRPQEGLWCDPAKLLIDPYARELDGELRWHDSVFSRRHDDSAAHVPKCVVRETLADATGHVHVPWSETIFYEANVRGYTMCHPALDAELRGTFDGMRHAEIIGYLKSLGVTSIELMPVQSFVDEHHLFVQGLRNYWGYNTVNFFAPMARYARHDPVSEFRLMVNALHDAGLEVIMDVVYNHTAEGDHRGATLSFRGLDNLAYYRTVPGHPGQYVNDTGCGNTIKADSGVVQDLVRASLRYWSRDMGVDGFRFDLAPVLGRSEKAYSAQHPLLAAIREDAQLQNVKLIAEPWDIGPGGYQLGAFAPQFAEWNDRFRDTARKFWRGDEGQCGELARRMHGSGDLFEAGGRLPAASVNLVTAHDGFTLLDLVSYERRHNEANGENNGDGHAHNFSVNHGVEGKTGDEAIQARRRRHRLNLLTTMFASQGTPLLLAGDEFGNTQSGNNNAYAQDNEIGWLDWSGIEADPDFTESVKALIRLRRELPLLRLDRYIHGNESRGGVETVLRWINTSGDACSDADWKSGHAFGLWLTQAQDGQTSDAVVVLMNAGDSEITFNLGSLSPSFTLRFCSARDSVQVWEGLLKLPAATVAIVSDSNSTGTD